MLLEEHIRMLRQNVYRSNSTVTIFVERNLGFEAEHHKHALAIYLACDFMWTRRLDVLVFLLQNL